MQKVRQQKTALLITLYILRINGYYGSNAPTKRHALNFIRKKNLLQFPEEELGMRNSSDTDEIWANDICWKKKDLDRDGLIESTERGKWQITPAGIEKIDEKKRDWLKFENKKDRESFTQNFKYVTGELMDWMLKIARGEDLSLVKTATVVSHSERGSEGAAWPASCLAFCGVNDGNRNEL